MTRVGASALHLVPGRKPSLRVQRRFVAGDEAVVQPTDIDELTRDMLFSDHRERLATDGHVEVLYVSRSGRRYRATIASAAEQCSLVLRPLPEGTPKLEVLELPEQVGAFARGRSGFVPVAGFFGSGKSTTLAAITGVLNQDPSRHVVTIEDAIEHVHDNGAALLHQREVGAHVATAADGIRQALATGVDAIVVGEIRCAETLDAAIAAAESGCLVFAGVEAGSIVGALADLTLLVPSEERPRLRVRLSRVLRGAMAQSLLQRSHRAGRVAVVEILVGNQAARAAIRNGNFHELTAIMQRCRGLGMQTIDLALRALLAHHVVTQEEALLHATNRDEVLTRGPVVPTR
ncbi:MAG: Flp pilus assembly complex ATPase component TadA [Planctomycetes bacterium]|nr:Flp pilus assembly complex ATPase component TadA [Planctomycetota bacterium]